MTRDRRGRRSHDAFASHPADRRRTGALRRDRRRTGADGGVTGVAALVGTGEDAHVTAHGALGLGRPPVQRDSLFRISSTTKPITGALTVALVREGHQALRLESARPASDTCAGARNRAGNRTRSAGGVASRHGRGSRRQRRHPAEAGPAATGRATGRRRERGAGPARRRHHLWGHGVPAGTAGLAACHHRQPGPRGGPRLHNNRHYHPIDTRAEDPAPLTTAELAKVFSPGQGGGPMEVSPDCAGGHPSAGHPGAEGGRLRPGAAADHHRHRHRRALRGAGRHLQPGGRPVAHPGGQGVRPGAAVRRGQRLPCSPGYSAGRSSFTAPNPMPARSTSRC